MCGVCFVCCWVCGLFYFYFFYFYFWGGGAVWGVGGGGLLGFVVVFLYFVGVFFCIVSFDPR